MTIKNAHLIKGRALLGKDRVYKKLKCALIKQLSVEPLRQYHERASAAVVQCFVCDRSFQTASARIIPFLATDHVNFASRNPILNCEWGIPDNQFTFI